MKFLINYIFYTYIDFNKWLYQSNFHIKQIYMEEVYSSPFR